MTDLRSHYESLLRTLSDSLENGPESLKTWVKTLEEYGTAASDLTKDEWAIVTAYLKSDLKAFEKESESYTDEVKHGVLAETLWQRLALITDQSQVEWHELMNDFKHQGVYDAEEWIGFGDLVCEQCGRTLSITHMQKIEPCAQCGHQHFHRNPLSPQV